MTDLEEHVSRLESMRDDKGDTWGLSPNDQESIAVVLAALADAASELGAAEETLLSVAAALDAAGAPAVPGLPQRVKALADAALAIEAALREALIGLATSIPESAYTLAVAAAVVRANHALARPASAALERLRVLEACAVMLREVTPCLSLVSTLRHECEDALARLDALEKTHEHYA